MPKPESITSNAGALRVAIIGAGALGQQIAQHLRQSGNWTVMGFFDDLLAPGKPTANGLVLGQVATIAEYYAAGAFDALFMGIGYKHLSVRQQLFEALMPLIPFARFVHSTAYVDASAIVAPGCFVSPGCILDLNVNLGPNTFLYSGCVLAHDDVLAGHSFLAPGVCLAGHVTVGPRCFLGIGTTITDGVQLGPDVLTGAGAIVIGNLTEPGMYMGAPAKKLLNFMDQA